MNPWFSRSEPHKDLLFSRLKHSSYYGKQNEFRERGFIFMVAGTAVIVLAILFNFALCVSTIVEGLSLFLFTFARFLHCLI